MSHPAEHDILHSWQLNARPWIAAVREGQIKSRVELTNQAIVEVVTGLSPQSLLDVGCGEGWLVRALADQGIACLGVDMIPELIAAAEQAGGGRFRQLSYAETSFAHLQESFDVAVCNFSLIGKESVEQLFQQIPALLNPGGAFIIQTLHPVYGRGAWPYKDGWQEGSWAGFDQAFSQPAPWYFRTLESWQELFENSGLGLREIIEPRKTATDQPLSVIFVGSPA
ncbi:MAG: class I SAM-dependent methyltransferase [Bacteroidota bacterium]